ncbi:hypothetical protein PISMIDRAFT_676547 [Pisolithus microcarpus 441]|uniref:Uncharacterized protein n=1 Tax=Pisolithus microcarpus 441 TaxID=765257 RepID=A0A0D0A1U4_9AGAM|nr:hypothetical protein PISMIDRAFT_676547 [Pisolithus microcarpus 441]
MTGVQNPAHHGARRDDSCYAPTPHFPAPIVSCSFRYSCAPSMYHVLSMPHRSYGMARTKRDYVSDTFHLRNSGVPFTYTRSSSLKF